MKHGTMKAGKEQPISPRLASELGTMFYYHPPKTLSRNLRKMFMDYVITELEVGASDYCEELILGLNWLFNFLDVAEEEMDVKECSTETAICSTSPLREPRGSLDSVIKFIVAMVQPERIYMLEYADPMDNEDGSYYDLLVVLPDASQRPFRHYEVLIELCCFGNDHVNCSLHQSAILNRYIRRVTFSTRRCAATSTCYTATSRAAYSYPTWQSWRRQESGQGIRLGPATERLYHSWRVQRDILRKERMIYVSLCCNRLLS